jgi:hypothetical protein
VSGITFGVQFGDIHDYGLILCLFYSLLSVSTPSSMILYLNLKSIQKLKVPLTGLDHPFNQSLRMTQQERS